MDATCNAESDDPFDLGDAEIAIRNPVVVDGPDAPNGVIVGGEIAWVSISAEQIASRRR